MNNKKKKYKEWELLALEAIKLAFDDKERVDWSRGEQVINQAKQLLVEAISLVPNSAWPFIRLADLCTDNKEKAKLYIDSLKVENNIHSKILFFDILVKDRPDLIQSFISENKNGS